MIHYDADRGQLVARRVDAFVERRWPVHPDAWECSDVDAGFVVMRHRHATVAWETGWAMSVLWGTCTYSDNHDADLATGEPFTETPARVEVGVLVAGDLWDEPFQYVPAGVLIDLADHLAAGTWPPPPGCPCSTCAAVRADDSA